MQKFSRTYASELEAFRKMNQQLAPQFEALRKAAHAHKALLASASPPPAPMPFLDLEKPTHRRRTIVGQR